MELKNIKGIGPAKAVKLKEAGIHDVEQMARADVAAVAKKSGLSEAGVKEYKERATALLLLEDVRGVGPATIETLAQAGVRSLRDFYEASSERLAKEMRIAQDRVQQLQQEAQELYEHVREQSRTPEGRKRLAEEGKDFAQRSARSAEEASRKAIERARRDGEIALQKARELRDKAPEAAREAQERSKAAFQEAEVRLRDVREKAEHVYRDAEHRVRQEADKVRTANEGLLTRLKQRLAGGKDGKAAKPAEEE